MTRASTIRSRLLAHVALAVGISCAAPGLAQDVQQDDEAEYEQIVVTGASVRQGGAQDIKHFRSVALDGSFLPQTTSLTIEGLMGEHDLTLPALAGCRQTFCLTGHAMPASLPLRAGDTHFVGLGFASNIDADGWRAEPLSLIAVVDRSGSMSGEPIERVKEGLRAVLSKMRKGDRMGIVLYGPEAIEYLPVTEVGSDRTRIARAIDAIEIVGSTNMEEGLHKGYALAMEELPRSHGKTRLMLFTDENPNVGDTSAEGFMGQAVNGSQRGVGLTTIGVGVHFDAELATHVSSVRGGNLFFLDEEGSGRSLFDREFFNMVSEVAHDIALTLAPPAGYRITGVFGVPDDVMTSAPDGAVKVTINTAFLSGNGGGIYVTLGKDGDHAHLPVAELAAGTPLLTGTLDYLDARSGQAGHDRIVVNQAAGTAPETLQVAHALVDEYLTLKSALAAFHERNDKKAAFHQLDGLAQRLGNVAAADLASERKLVGDLRDRAAFVAGYAGELPRSLRPLALKGEWQVTYQRGLDDIARGDGVEITEDGEMITDRQRPGRGEAEITQAVKVNESQLYIPEAKLVFDYRLQGDRVILTTPDSSGQLILRRTDTNS